MRTFVLAVVLMAGCGNGDCKEPEGFYRVVSTELPGGSCGAIEDDVAEFDGVAIRADCEGDRFMTDDCIMVMDYTCPTAEGDFISFNGEMSAYDRGIWVGDVQISLHDAGGVLVCSGQYEMRFIPL